MKYPFSRRLVLLLAQCPLWLGVLSLCPLAIAGPAWSQEQPSYPSSPEIDASYLDSARRDLLRTLITMPIRAKLKERLELRERLCPDMIKRPDPAQVSLKAALAIVESSMHTEVLLEKSAGPGADTPAEKFSLLVNLGKSDVLIRSSAPRFSTEVAGVSISYPGEHTRNIWLEGKDGTSFLVLVPSVAKCSIHSVVICPRIFDKKGSLMSTKYMPTAARYFIQTKADGLFSPQKEAAGRVMASVRGSRGVPMPTPWMKDHVSPKTPTVTLKTATPTDAPVPFTPITLPSSATVESRLDFGTESADQRAVSSRAHIEISEFELKDWPSVRVQTAELRVEPGRCFQVTQWGDTQY